MMMIISKKEKPAGLYIAKSISTGHIVQLLHVTILAIEFTTSVFVSVNEKLNLPVVERYLKLKVRS